MIGTRSILVSILFLSIIGIAIFVYREAILLTQTRQSPPPPVVDVEAPEEAPVVFEPLLSLQGRVLSVDPEASLIRLSVEDPRLHAQGIMDRQVRIGSTTILSQTSPDTTGEALEKMNVYRESQQQGMAPLDTMPPQLFLRTQIELADLRPGLLVYVVSETDMRGENVTLKSIELLPVQTPATSNIETIFKRP